MDDQTLMNNIKWIGIINVDEQGLSECGMFIHLLVAPLSPL